MEKSKMRVNKTVIALALTTAFLSACSSTGENDADLTGGQTGVIDASVSGYNEDTTGYRDNTAVYDPLLQGINDDPNSVLAVDRVGDESSTISNNGVNIIGSENVKFPVSNDTVYFTYDSSQVRAEFIPIINAYSQQLLANPEQVVILEGHADERGSREYNIALGEERAKAVAKMIIAKGVFSGQLEIVSYGEEKPASNRHDEAGWLLNRRVKLIYQRTSK